MSFNPYNPRTQVEHVPEPRTNERVVKSSIVPNESGDLHEVTEVVEVDAFKEMSQYRESDFRLQNVMLAGAVGLLRQVPLMEGSRLDVADAVSSSLGKLSEFKSNYEQQNKLLAEKAAAEKAAAEQAAAVAAPANPIVSPSNPE